MKVVDEVTTADVEWIETNLLPKITKSIGIERNSIRCNVTAPKNSFYSTYVYFLDLEFNGNTRFDKSEKENTLRLVIKKFVKSSNVAPRLAMVEDFHNEILFYTKFAIGSSQFPHCFYASAETRLDTLIVLENLSAQGYAICPDVYNIPMEYTIAAINEIARFHAMAYAMKEREPKRFHNIVSDIQSRRFDRDVWFCELVSVNATRPINWLRRNNCDKKFCEIMEKVLGNAFEEIILDAIKPIEPLATLCHGDFTRNNVFFRKVDGKLEAKLFDFALIMYSSPAIDLSTFLYLACSAKDRTERFDEIFRSYHSTLIGYLRDSGIEDLEKYSYEKMLADYKRRASFGCLVAIFFLPVLYGHIGMFVETFATESLTRAEDVKKAGGESMTEIFGKMIIELQELGSFDHLI